MGLFDAFRLVMTGPFAPREAGDIAALLAVHAREVAAARGLADAEILCGGEIVTLFLTERDPWEAVVVGANAYQLYPGFISADGGSITWPNIWVADDYPLDTFIAALEEAFAAAGRALH